MVEAVFAAVGLLVCVGLLARLCLGAERRRRLDAGFRRAAASLVQGARGLGKRAAPSRRPGGRAGDAAADAAADALARQAIERARRRSADIDRQGNVIRPRSFQDRKGPDEPLH